MNYSAFQREFKKGTIRPVYLFSGKEDHLAETAVQSLIDKLLQPEDKTLNLVIFYGSEADNLPDTIATPPLFSERRVTVVRQAEQLSGIPLSAVIKYVKSPPSDGCLILITDAADKRRKLFRETEDLIEPVNCTRLREREQTAWVNEYVGKLNKRLNADAMGRLMAVNWPSLRELASELDRLILMVGDQQVITTKDIDESGGCSFVMDRWRLTDAIAGGDTSLAMKTLQNIQLWDIKPTRIISDIFRLYQKLWIIKWAQKHGKIPQVKGKLNLMPFLFTRYSNFAKNASIKGLEDGLIRILDADLNIKRGIRPGDQEVNLLVSDLVRTINI